MKLNSKRPFRKEASAWSAETCRSFSTLNALKHELRQVSALQGGASLDTPGTLAIDKMSRA